MSEQEITKIVIATIKAMQNAIFAIPTDEFNNFKYPSLTINWDAKNQELVLKSINYNSWNSLYVYKHKIVYHPEHGDMKTVCNKGFMDFYESAEG